MRSHALYDVGICAALAALAVAAPAIKNARADTPCGVTTVYVTIPAAPQTFDLTSTLNKVTSSYTTLVETVGAKSITDGLTGQPVNSTLQATTALRETTFVPVTETGAAKPKTEKTPTSSTSSGPHSDDYVFPNHGAGTETGTSPSATISFTLHPLIPLSGLVTSVQSTRTNTFVDANIGGKASNTDVYVVDQTFTVIPISTVSAAVTSTDQASIPTAKNALVSASYVDSTTLATAVTPEAASSTTWISGAEDLTNTASLTTSGSAGLSGINPSSRNAVKDSSTTSYSTLSSYPFPSTACLTCVALPTDTFDGAAHSGFQSFPTSAGNTGSESSSPTLTKSTAGPQTTIASSPFGKTPADVSSSKTYTEGHVTGSANSTTSSASGSGHVALPVAAPRSGYLIQSSTDTSKSSSSILSSVFSENSTELSSTTPSLTASLTATLVPASEVDGLTRSSTTTLGLSSSESVTSIIVTSVLTFTTSASTSNGLAISGDVSATSVSNGTASSNFVSSGPSSTGVTGTTSTDSATSTLANTITTLSSLSSSSQAKPTTCTELPDSTLNFDDLPRQSAFDNATAQPMPLFSPYHKFYFSGGFTIVPPPTDPYLPSSGRLLVEFLATPDSDLGTTGAIGNGRNELSGCFNFNALSLNVGCDSTGPSCDWYFSGYQYDVVSASFNQITSQSISTASCPDLTNCSLIPITLDHSFQNMTEIRIHLTVAGEDKIWWMDDLRLEWFDKCCDAQLCRSKVR